MTNEIISKMESGPLADVAMSGVDVVKGKTTRLPLSGKNAVKGGYIVGKYLGMETFAFNEAGDKITVANFAVLETNLEGDTGEVVAGELCSVSASGLLAWGLQKCAAGRILFVRFDGKGPAESKDGNIREMNRFTVKDVTDAMAARGIL